AEVVPAQVQSGTGPDLETPEPEARRAGDREESADERRGATDLVRLHAALERRSEVRQMLGDEGAKGRPGTCTVTIATGRRVVRRERRRAPFEDQPMH